MATRLILIGVMVLFTSRSVASPCDCLDIYDLVSRRSGVVAAMATFQAAVDEWARNGSPPADEDARQVVRTRVQHEIGKVIKQDAHLGEAVTDTDCKVTNTSETACMRKTVTEHEAVHVDRCNREGWDRWPDLSAYAREEIAGYQKELEWIDSELRRLENSDCPFVLDYRREMDLTVCAPGSGCSRVRRLNETEIPLHMEPSGAYSGEAAAPELFSVRRSGSDMTATHDGQSILHVGVTGTMVIAAGVMNVRLAVRRAGLSQHVTWKGWAGSGSIDTPLPSLDESGCGHEMCTGFDMPLQRDRFNRWVMTIPVGTETYLVRLRLK